MRIFEEGVVRSISGMKSLDDSCPAALSLML